MFRFKALELMNWDCYPHYRVPLDGDIVLLVGQNGSGKTTFLDALRVLLNSPRLSKNRALQHYIQPEVEIAMIKGVVTNNIVRGRRPFAHLGINTDVDVSLICLLHNKIQKIEKEFFILKGDVPLDEIKKLKGGLKSLQYSRQLEEAGVSRSTLKLIALEQGETDRIVQLSPNELLQLVMDITGNREIIKRYEEARKNYKKCSRQLIDLRAEYNKICDQTKELERLAKQAQTYKNLLDEKKLIEEEKLPIARWYNILNKIKNIENIFSELNENKVKLQKKIQDIIEKKELLKGEINNIDNKQEVLKEKEKKYQQEINHLNQEIGKCNSEWERLEELKRECENLPSDLDKQAIKEELEKTQELYFNYKNQIVDLEKEIEDLQEELKNLKKNKIPKYPHEIYNFREVLKNKDIDHLMLAECIEIIEPKWQLAIESFLGRDRFSIFVSEDDFLEAKKLGEKYEYPYYISEFNEKDLPIDIHPKSILAHIKVVDPRIRGRVIGLNNILLVETVEEGHKYKDYITITLKGYRQDKKGGIFIAKNIKFYCGALAIEGQVKELQAEIEEKEDEIIRIRLQMQKANKKIKELENKLLSIKKKEEWEKYKEEYSKLKREGEELILKSHEIIKKRNKVSEEIDKLIEKKNKIIAEFQTLEVEKENLEKEYKQLETTFKQKEEQLLELKWQKEELEKKIPENTTKAYTPDQVDSPEWLEHKLKEIEHHIEMYSGCKDLSLIPLYEHEKAQLEAKRKQLDKQEEEQKKRFQELEKCRQDYKEMIEQTIEFYKKALKDLASLANCRIKTELVFGQGESLIEDAKLYVSISFDKKKYVDIHDKSLSGGQDVIASLILLVALSRIEQEVGGGFFIMDEHNAHLDMLRIVEVGHFLRSTKAQFILTTPTTENISALSVADLIITFTKRKPNQKYAPKPRYIRKI